MQNWQYSITKNFFLWRNHDLWSTMFTLACSLFPKHEYGTTFALILCQHVCCWKLLCGLRFFFPNCWRKLLVGACSAKDMRYISAVLCSKFVTIIQNQVARTYHISTWTGREELQIYQKQTRNQSVQTYMQRPKVLVSQNAIFQPQVTDPYSRGCSSPLGANGINK